MNIPGYDAFAQKVAELWDEAEREAAAAHDTPPDPPADGSAKPAAPHTSFVIETGSRPHERIYADRDGRTWMFTGATYSHKRAFGASGATWDRSLMAWTYTGDYIPLGIRKLGDVKPLHVGAPPAPAAAPATGEQPRIITVDRIVEKRVYRNLTYKRVGRKPPARQRVRRRPARSASEGFVPPSYWERLALYLQPGMCRPAIALVGPAGNGKTTTVEQVFKAMDYDYIVIDANDRMEASDLIGGMSFAQKNGEASEVWRDGPVTRAFREGKAILINEFDALDPRAAMCLQSVMQDPGKNRTGRYVTLPGNPDEDRVYPADDCPLVLTMNTFGDGPNREYVGRNALDAASKDRLTIIDTGYENEDKILIAKGFTSTTAQDLVQWATEMRRRINRDGLRIILSNRTLIRMAQAMEQYGWTFKETVEREFLARVGEAERKLLEEHRR